MSDPMTDDDLAYQRWSRNDLLAEVRQLQKERQGMVAETSWDDLATELTEAEAENARLRAERDEIESGYYVLLSQFHRLEEERNQLRVERTAMLDALEAAQVLADLDTWSWEDRQGALREWDQRIARVRDVQRRTTVREPTDITGGHMGADRRRP